MGATKPDNSTGSFGKWKLYCSEKPVSGDDCALAETVQGNNSNDRFGIALSYNKVDTLTARLEIEPKPVQTEGVALLVDGVQAEIVTPKNCTPKGCSATWSLSPSLIGQLLGGKELEAQFRVRPAHGTSLTIDLADLSQALVAMRKKFRPTPLRTTGSFRLARGTRSRPKYRPPKAPGNSRMQRKPAAASWRSW